LTGPLRTDTQTDRQTDRQTHIELTHYLRHSLRSLGGDNNSGAGAAADKAASSKETKYRQLANSHVFVPVAIETAGTWNHLAVELTQELGRRITAVTDDPRQTGFLFQRLSAALQRGNAVSFHSTFTTE